MKKSETARFIAVIDIKATSEFQYKALNAPSLIAAMTEAAEFIDDDTYLVNIFQRDYHSGEKERVLYNKVLTNRGNGWHTNDDPHASERETAIYFYHKWHDGISPITASDITWKI